MQIIYGFASRISFVFSTNSAVVELFLMFSEIESSVLFCSTLLIVSSDAEGKTGSAPVFVFKENGKCEYFFVGDYFNLLEKGQNIALPD